MTIAKRVLPWVMGGLIWVFSVAACSSARTSVAPSAALPPSSSGFHAVLLNNGQAFFGKLQGFGTPYPVLRDVFYIQTGQNKDTKEATYVLIKRGKEAHAPDWMLLNAADIVFVEPVAKDSKVAQLIAQSH